MKAFKSSNFIALEVPNYSEDEILQKSEQFFLEMNRRRSIREFSDKPIGLDVINNIIRAASTAPSGAHRQPWVFCVVSDPEIKKHVREAAEKEEYKNYNGRMSERWLQDLEPFNTDWNKPFLETAPYLIVVFKKAYEINADGGKVNNYYVNESVGIATGFLLAAIQQAGLSALTHTPSPMNFLTKVLERPENERPFLLIPVGLPATDCKVPDIERKGLDEVMALY